MTAPADIGPKVKRSRGKRARKPPSEKAWKARQARAAIRTEERRTLRKLRAQLKRARAEKASRLAKGRHHIKRARLRLREDVKKFRKEWREYVNALVAKRRARARAAWQQRLAKIMLRPGRKVDAQREALAEYRRELASVRGVAKRVTRPKGVRAAYVARAESDDMVLNNLPRELHSVWAKMKNKITTARAKMSRTEAFLHWCEENPEELIRLQWGSDDQARLEKELEEAETAARTVRKAERNLSEAELDALAAF